MSEADIWQVRNRLYARQKAINSHPKKAFFGNEFGHKFIIL